MKDQLLTCLLMMPTVNTCTTLQECKRDQDDCARSPCGANAVCRNLLGGYDCKCRPGCTGDARAGCSCPVTEDPCR